MNASRIAIDGVTSLVSRFLVTFFLAIWTTAALVAPAIAQPVEGDSVELPLADLRDEEALSAIETMIDALDALRHVSGRHFRELGLAQKSFAEQPSPSTEAILVDVNSRVLTEQDAVLGDFVGAAQVALGELRRSSNALHSLRKTIDNQRAEYRDQTQRHSQKATMMDSRLYKVAKHAESALHSDVPLDEKLAHSVRALYLYRQLEVALAAAARAEAHNVVVDTMDIDKGLAGLAHYVGEVQTAITVAETRRAGLSQMAGIQAKAVARIRAVRNTAALVKRMNGTAAALRGVGAGPLPMAAYRRKGGLIGDVAPDESAKKILREALASDPKKNEDEVAANTTVGNLPKLGVKK